MKRFFTVMENIFFFLAFSFKLNKQKYKKSTFFSFFSFFFTIQRDISLGIRAKPKKNKNKIK